MSCCDRTLSFLDRRRVAAVVVVVFVASSLWCVYILVLRVLYLLFERLQRLYFSLISTCVKEVLVCE
jgi:hypothetical protein